MKQLAKSHSFTAKSKIKSNVESEQRVLDLLESLEHDADNFTNNIKTFEDYYFG